MSAQNLDSLWNVWEDEMQHDTIRLDALYMYCMKKHIYTQPDSALHYFNRSIEMANRTKNNRIRGQMYNLKGVAYSQKQDGKNALDGFEEALNYFIISGDKGRQAWVYVNIAGVYANQFNWFATIKYLNLSQKPAEESGDLQALGNRVNMLASAYYFMDNYQEALRYSLESIEYMKIDDSPWANYNYSNALVNIGILYRELKDFSNARNYFLESIKSGKKNGFTDVIANGEIELGKLAMALNKYDSAKTHLDNGYRLIQEIEDVYLNTDLAIYYGKFYEQQGEYRLMIKWCNDAFNIISKTEMIVQQRDACECLYKAYRYIHDDSKALVYHEKMLLLNDSLQKEEAQKQLQQMEFSKQVYQDSVDTFEKERKVELAHQEEMRQEEQQRNIAIGSGFLVLLLAGGIYSRLRYVRKSKAIIEKEKDRSENLLHNILPEEVAAELKEKGESEAKDFENVTVLFSDFKGFTQTSEKLSAKELVQELNICFKAFDEIMTSHNLEKIKTIGDAYMAAGGLHVPRTSKPLDVVKAGLEMQQFMLSRKAEKEKLSEPYFEMRVGIHTGPVVAGIVGVKKFQYDIWGDTVNTASRMESHGVVGKVNMSSATYELIKDQKEFTFEKREAIEVKGKGEMEMWLVV
jgi:class 3 adenylate cyclase